MGCSGSKLTVAPAAAPATIDTTTTTASPAPPPLPPPPRPTDFPKSARRISVNGPTPEPGAEPSVRGSLAADKRREREDLFRHEGPEMLERNGLRSYRRELLALDEKLAQDDNQDTRRQRRKSRRGSHSARPMSRVSTGSRRSSEGDLDVHAATPKKDPSIKSITDNTPDESRSRGGTARHRSKSRDVSHASMDAHGSGSGTGAGSSAASQGSSPAASRGHGKSDADLAREGGAAGEGGSGSGGGGSARDGRAASSGDVRRDEGEHEGSGNDDDDDDDGSTGSGDSEEKALLELPVEDLIARGYGMNEVANRMIVEHLKSEDCTATEIQRLFHSTVAVHRSMEFFIMIGELLIQKGEPLMAEEILYQGTEQFKERRAVRLRQLHGLALAQGGSTDRAIKNLEELRASGDFDDESGGLLARCYKDKANRERDPELRRAILSKAHAIYKEAYESSGRTSYYTGINTATMALLTGLDVEADQVAREVVALCEGEIATWASAEDKDNKGAYWVLATLGEASVIAGNFDRAAEYYKRARACAPKDYVKIASTQRQLRLLLEYVFRRSATPASMLQDDAHTPASLHRSESKDLASGRLPPGSVGGASGGGLAPSGSTPALMIGAGARSTAGAVSGRRGASEEGAGGTASGPDGGETDEGGRPQRRRGKVHSFEDMTSPKGSLVAGRSTAGPSAVEVDVPPGTLRTLTNTGTGTGAGLLSGSLPQGMSIDTMMSPVGPFRAMFDLPSVVVFISAELHESVVPTADAQVTIARRLTKTLESLNAGFGYAAPSTVADILFLEAVRRRGGEIYLLLPVPLEVHLRYCAKRFREAEVFLGEEDPWASVDFAAQSTRAGAGKGSGFADLAMDDDDALLLGYHHGQPGDEVDDAARRRRISLFRSSGLIRRLRNLISSASRVDVSNDMSPESSVTNRHYCSLILNGLAVKRARSLGTVVERIFIKANIHKARDSPKGVDGYSSEESGHIILHDDSGEHPSSGRNPGQRRDRLALGLGAGQLFEVSSDSEGFDDDEEGEDGREDGDEFDERATGLGLDELHGGRRIRGAVGGIQDRRVHGGGLFARRKGLGQNQRASQSFQGGMRTGLLAGGSHDAESLVAGGSRSSQASRSRGRSRAGSTSARGRMGSGERASGGEEGEDPDAVHGGDNEAGGVAEEDAVGLSEAPAGGASNPVTPTGRSPQFLTKRAFSSGQLERSPKLDHGDGKHGEHGANHHHRRTSRGRPVRSRSRRGSRSRRAGGADGDGDGDGEARAGTEADAEGETPSSAHGNPDARSSGSESSLAARASAGIVSPVVAATSAGSAASVAGVGLVVVGGGSPSLQLAASAKTSSSTTATGSSNPDMMREGFDSRGLPLAVHAGVDQTAGTPTSSTSSSSSSTSSSSSSSSFAEAGGPPVMLMRSGGLASGLPANVPSSFKSDAGSSTNSSAGPGTLASTVTPGNIAMRGFSGLHDGTPGSLRHSESPDKFQSPTLAVHPEELEEELVAAGATVHTGPNLRSPPPSARMAGRGSSNPLDNPVVSPLPPAELSPQGPVRLPPVSGLAGGSAGLLPSTSGSLPPIPAAGGPSGGRLPSGGGSGRPSPPNLTMDQVVSAREDPGSSGYRKKPTLSPLQTSPSDSTLHPVMDGAGAGADGAGAGGGAGTAGGGYTAPHSPTAVHGLTGTPAAVEQWISQRNPFRVLHFGAALLPGSDIGRPYQGTYQVAVPRVAHKVAVQPGRMLLPPPPGAPGATVGAPGASGAPGAPGAGPDGVDLAYLSFSDPTRDGRHGVDDDGHSITGSVTGTAVGAGRTIADLLAAAATRLALGGKERPLLVDGRPAPDELLNPLSPIENCPSVLDLVPGLHARTNDARARPPIADGLGAGASFADGDQQSVAGGAGGAGGGAGGGGPTGATASGPGSVVSAPAAAPASGSGSRQVIMAILFADIVGYSKLGELQVLSFIENFMGAVANLIDSLPRRQQPRVRNTWGDAFYFVFQRVPDAGAFSLMLSDLVTKTPWEAMGLPKSLNIRISLHAAPVHVVTDPVIGQRNYTGVHTSRAARIEPITPPGSVYCSQAFAAIAETLNVNSFECDYVGNMPLAKNYGLQPVYHVRWASSLIKRPKLVHNHLRNKLTAVATRARLRASQISPSMGALVGGVGASSGTLPTAGAAGGGGGGGGGGVGGILARVKPTFGGKIEEADEGTGSKGAASGSGTATAGVA